MNWMMVRCTLTDFEDVSNSIVEHQSFVAKFTNLLPTASDNSLDMFHRALTRSVQQREPFISGDKEQEDHNSHSQLLLRKFILDSQVA
jgi:hypothetical protein